MNKQIIFTAEDYAVSNGETGWCVKDGDDTLADFYGPDAKANAEVFAEISNIRAAVAKATTQS